MTRLHAVIAAVMICPLALTACKSNVPEAGSGAGPAGHTVITTEKLEPYECGTITRLHTYQDVFLASQPAPSDFELAKQGGVRAVIDLRHDRETPDLDERAVVTGLGLTYVNLPWSGPEELTDAKLDEMRRQLREAERPVLLHCASANRVGAAWLAYRVLDDGATVDEALAEAKIVGMRSSGSEAKTLDYIQRNRQN